MSLEIP